MGLKNIYSTIYTMPTQITPQIEIVRNIEYNDKYPLISIVMPIHNQCDIISTNLDLILENTTESLYEIIMILDSCSDVSESIVIQWISKVSSELITRILVLRSDEPLFETVADNIGFKLAKGPYWMEIQADMQILEKGYNMLLLKPFQQNENIIAISGRCCHGLTYNAGIGKLGESIEYKLSSEIRRDGFYVAETCNRGPLLLKADKVKELRYLDQDHFFLDNSDHDLMARAYAYRGWICGYVAIEVVSILTQGSTRKPRNAKNQEVYNRLKQRSSEEAFLFKYLRSNPTPRPITFIEFY
jgi:glycosyltransferase involved in cell wall biosynthesis